MRVRERQTEKQTGIVRHTETERKKERLTEREKDRETERE